MFETIKNAIAQLWGNKLRTFLTMLGMLIGIGSVIIILGLGEGLKGYIMGQFGDVGKGTIEVRCYDSVNEHLLGDEDVEMMKDIPEVKDAMLIHQNYVGVTQNYKKEDKMLLLYGLPYNYEEIQSLRLRFGRMFNEKDEQVRANVIIVEDNFARLMFKKSDPAYVIGKSIDVLVGGEKQSFEIIGVTKSFYPSVCPDEMVMPIVYMPFATMDQYVMDGQRKTAFMAVLINDDCEVKEFTKPIRKLLEKQHAAEDAYGVNATIEDIEAFDTVMNTVNLFVSVVAAISLLVGGIGIMNIMMVTVRERTREIGIRKALGATDKQIMTQFLIEALILTMIGGVSGLVIGYVGCVLIAGAMSVTPHLTGGMIAFSVGVSSVIGIVFGVYPAYRASKLDPVEALREE